MFGIDFGGPIEEKDSCLEGCHVAVLCLRFGRLGRLDVYHVLRHPSVPGPGNASEWLPGKFLERLLGLGMEMLENGFLEGSWSDSWAWVWKCFKIASWKLPGATSGLGLGNT